MNTKAIKLGNPKLRLISEPVHQNDFGSKELRELVDLLFDTMHEEGGVGLAAPQIGINKRLLVFGMEKSPYPDRESVPYTTLINPTIEFLTEETEEAYEGCISVGALRGKVPRKTKIYYTGYDIEGNIIEREVSGFHARVVQHEYDHLDGIIFLDRMKDFSSLGFHDELIASGLLHIKQQA
jgi:peptide deformylase